MKSSNYSLLIVMLISILTSGADLKAQPASNIEAISQFEFDFTDRAYDLAYHDGFVYVATIDGDLLIYNISDATQISLTSRIDLMEDGYAGAGRILFKDNLAIVTVQGVGVYFIDISDIQNPSVELFEELDYRDHYLADVEGNLLFLADADKVHVWQINGWRQVSTIEIPETIRGLSVNGDRLAVCANGYEAKVRLFDISNPGDPAQVAELDTGFGDEIYLGDDFWISHGKDEREGSLKYEVVAITEDNRIIPRHRFESFNLVDMGQGRMFAEGDRVWIPAKQQIDVYDLSDNQNPEIVESRHITPLDSFDYFTVIGHDEDNLIIANSFSTNFVPLDLAGFSVHDISEADTTIMSGKYRRGGNLTNLRIVNDYAFISYSNNVSIVDVTDRDHPVERTYIDMSEIVTGLSFNSDGAMIVVTQRSGISSWDVTDPLNPEKLDSVMIDSLWNWEGPVVKDDIAYYRVSAFRRQLLLSIDISDPRNLHELDRVEVQHIDGIVGAVSDAGFLYLSEDRTPSGICVFDVREPTNIIPRGRTAYGGVFAWQGEYLLGPYGGGLRKWDISDPLNPTIGINWRISINARFAQFSPNDNYIAIADNRGMTLVYNDALNYHVTTGYYGSDSPIKEAVFGQEADSSIIYAIDNSRLILLFAEEGLESKNDEATLHPVSFSLSAFPNPFNSSVTISFSSSSSSSLRIYDISGRLVADLTTADPPRSAGMHKVIWDATSVGAGVYFVRLEAGEEVRTEKIVLMR